MQPKYCFDESKGEFEMIGDYKSFVFFDSKDPENHPYVTGSKSGGANTWGSGGGPSSFGASTKPPCDGTIHQVKKEGEETEAFLASFDSAYLPKRELTFRPLLTSFDEKGRRLENDPGKVAGQENARNGGDQKSVIVTQNFFSKDEAECLYRATQPYLRSMHSTFPIEYRASDRALCRMPKSFCELVFNRLLAVLDKHDVVGQHPMCFGHGGAWYPMAVNEVFKLSESSAPIRFGSKSAKNPDGDRLEEEEIEEFMVPCDEFTDERKAERSRKFTGSRDKEEGDQQWPKHLLGRDGFFTRHRDGPWIPREDQASVFTILIYLKGHHPNDYRHDHYCIDRDGLDLSCLSFDYQGRPSREWYPIVEEVKDCRFGSKVRMAGGETVLFPDCDDLGCDALTKSCYVGQAGSEASASHRESLGAHLVPPSSSPTQEKEETREHFVEQVKRRELIGSAIQCKHRRIRVPPRVGTMLLFPHFMQHGALPVLHGHKAVLRTELIFRRVSPLFRSSLDNYMNHPKYHYTRELYEKSQESLNSGDVKRFVDQYREVVENQYEVMKETPATLNFQVETDTRQIWLGGSSSQQGITSVDVVLQIVKFLSGYDVGKTLMCCSRVFFFLIAQAGGQFWRRELFRLFPHAYEQFYAQRGCKVAPALVFEDDDDSSPSHRDRVRWEDRTSENYYRSPYPLQHLEDTVAWFDAFRRSAVHRNLLYPQLLTVHRSSVTLTELSPNPSINHPVLQVSVERKRKSGPTTNTSQVPHLRNKVTACTEFVGENHKEDLGSDDDGEELDGLDETDDLTAIGADLKCWLDVDGDMIPHHEVPEEDLSIYHFHLPDAERFVQIHRERVYNEESGDTEGENDERRAELNRRGDPDALNGAFLENTIYSSMQSDSDRAKLKRMFAVGELGSSEFYKIPRRRVFPVIQQPVVQETGDVAWAGIGRSLQALTGANSPSGTPEHPTWKFRRAFKTPPPTLVIVHHRQLKMGIVNRPNKHATQDLSGVKGSARELFICGGVSKVNFIHPVEATLYAAQSALRTKLFNQFQKKSVSCHVATLTESKNREGVAGIECFIYHFDDVRRSLSVEPAVRNPNNWMVDLFLPANLAKLAAGDTGSSSELATALHHQAMESANSYIPPDRRSLPRHVVLCLGICSHSSGNSFVGKEDAAISKKALSKLSGGVIGALETLAKTTPIKDKKHKTPVLVDLINTPLSIPVGAALFSETPEYEESCLYNW